jgi:ubiquinone/menaquinone biosynthesis C-methylase UbiE
MKTMALEISIQCHKDACRKSLSKYTTRAFQAIPRIEAPTILDIGCGSGVPTLELSRRCDGEVIGLDIDRSLLDLLEEKIRRAGLSDRVRAVEGSMFELGFPDESFDIIWAEGSISVIGFEKGIRDWRRFIKPGGYLVVFDQSRGLSEKLRHITSSGYTLIDHFEVKGEAFWEDYYIPLQKRIDNLRIEFRGDTQAQRALEKEQSEIDMVKRDPGKFDSTFFIIRKKTCAREGGV